MSDQNEGNQQVLSALSNYKINYEVDSSDL